MLEKLLFGIETFQNRNYKNRSRTVTLPNIDISPTRVPLQALGAWSVENSVLRKSYNLYNVKLAVTSINGILHLLCGF